MVHFFYKIYYVIRVALCSAVGKFFNTDKRSRREGLEVENKSISQETPEATTQYIQQEEYQLKNGAGLRKLEIKTLSSPRIDFECKQLLNVILAGRDI